MTQKKTKQKVTIIESTRLSDGVYSLTMEYPEGQAPAKVKPGQFVGVFTKDPARLLPRPISICGWDADKRQLRLVYRVVGNGTREFANWKTGEQADVLGILGNGYDLSVLTGKKILLLGGGIGAPPMLGLAQALYDANRRNGEEHPESLVTAVMGYRTDDLFLAEEFRKVCRLVVSTDDGTAGFHGNAVMAARAGLTAGWDEKCADAAGEKEEWCDAICSCGPLPMLRGVKKLGEELGVPTFLSLEERMACGVGACLGCVTKTTKKDAHSQVQNARICCEGPVFNAEDVEI